MFSFLVTLLSNIYPKAPASIEAVRIANLAASCNSCSLKESKEIKIDMVKPIPPNSPTPIMCIQRLACGKVLIFSLTAIKEKRLIPMSLPKISPKTTPTPKEEDNHSIMPDL